MADEIKPDDLNNQGDYISGDVGEDGKDVVVGKNIDTRSTQQHNTQRSDPQQTMRSDVHFNNADNAVIFQEIIRLSEKVDGLPDRVNSLEKERLDVARTAVTTAQAAAQLATQTAQAAATLAATKTANVPISTTTWIIIGLLFFIVAIGLFFAGKLF
jgi:hypothetical protein